MKTVVFDFDKTLTYKDSLTELFDTYIGNRILFRLFYYVLKVLSKCGLISVKTEKMSMIKLLFGSEEQRLKEACEKQEISFTPIFDKLKQAVEANERVIVLSASACYLLEVLFKDLKVEVFGTTFDVKNGKIRGIRQHPFDKEKVQVLNSHDIDVIDEMYFDSVHDECLIGMSRHWHRVKDGLIVEEK